MTVRRNFLFLQGVCSPFFRQLGDRLEADGHRVFKLNFNMGDLAYWWPRRSTNYRGSLADLRDYVDEFCRRFEISDQVLFGDRRPVHRAPVEHGEVLGLRTHVFEEGYFRPYWVTLEREGVNGHSLLPRDPDWFWETGARLANYGDGKAFEAPFFQRAVHDVAYHAAGLLNPLFFHRYRTHVPVIAPVEYLAYSRRLATLPFWEKRDETTVSELLRNNARYFLLPLQLGSDAQIRDHSRFEGMIEVIDFVLSSFARHASSADILVIKNHPLDIGLVNFREALAKLEKQYAIEGRTRYLETGPLDVLVRNAQGVVTVNSTVGGFSLGLGCPTITLSDPIYNLPKLCFQGNLDHFWLGRERPDKEFFRRFRNTVIHATQINGGFYSRQGIALAVENAARVLSAETSPLESLL